MNTFFTSIYEPFQFIVAISLLILLHEFGHFIAAHIFHIDVEEFGLGFPPRLLSLFKWRGTQYTLNWIPLGGFVRIKGETDPDVNGGLSAASPWVRIAVFLAGPATNLLLAVIFYAIIIMNIGMPVQNKVQVFQVAPDSPAYHAGLISGDLITHVNKIEITSQSTLLDSIAKNLGKETWITYQRGEETFETSLVPRTKHPSDEGAIGILMGNPTTPIRLLDAIPIAFETTYQIGNSLVTFPVMIMQGKVSPEEGRLVGYKGMYDMYQEFRDAETIPGIPKVTNVLRFFAMITVSLGLLNLLPIPALDGGRIILTIPEILVKRRIPQKYENLIHFVGFTALIALLIYINVQDFIHPIQLH